MGESGMDAHCHLQQLQTREVRARTVPFNFVTEPVPAWKKVFSIWQGDSGVKLPAVVYSHIFLCDWQ